MRLEFDGVMDIDMEQGKRFSLQYLERATPTQDSERFRNRLAAYFWKNLYSEHLDAITDAIRVETGARFPYSSVGIDIDAFFIKSELRDILDSITVIYSVLHARRYKNGAVNWVHFVSRVLEEENLGYKADSLGGIHYFVDEEFERNRFSTLSILDDQKYSASRAAYEDAYRHMDSDSMDTKAAVRSMFEAIEILVKQMLKVRNLNKNVVEKALKKLCMELYGNDEVAQKVNADLFDGFAKWVNALHNYRHGQDNEEPVAPSVDMAIYILSSGSSFLRWLAGMNNQIQGIDPITGQ